LISTGAFAEEPTATSPPTPVPTPPPTPVPIPTVPPTPAPTPLPQTTVSGPGIFSMFHFYLSGGARYSSWKPGFRSNFLDFTTEGSAAFEVNLDIDWLKYDVFAFKYERPFNNSPAQQDMLANNTTQESGLEKLKFAFWIQAFVDVFEIENPLLKLFFSTKFRYTKEIFYGDVEAVQAFAYVTKGTTVTKISDTVIEFSDLQRIAKGNSVAFRTVFEEYSVTMGTPVTPDERFEFRFGYYSINFVRPSDEDKRWKTVVDDLRVFYDTTFKSKGMQLSIGTMDPNAPGVGFLIDGRYGFSNDIESPVSDDYESYNPGKELKYLEGLFHFWYNHYFTADTKKKTGSYITIGASFNRRYFANEFRPFSGGVDNDNLYKGHMSFGWAF